MRQITKCLLESLNENYVGLTIKEYAINLLDGYIDTDVTDTEVDMIVAFTFDFNEETDTDFKAYGDFMNLIAERTKIVEVNGNTLVCNFSEVFKPYEDKLRDFFDMENSEFDEAYYEAVYNLEALISGNAGNSTYNELISILNSEPINEAASLTAKATYRGDDGTRDYIAGKISDGRYFLIDSQEEIIVSDKDLPKLAKRDMDNFTYEDDGDEEFIEALENGTSLDIDSDLAKIIIKASRKYLDDGGYLLSESSSIENASDNSIAEFIKDSVEKLQTTDYTNCKYDLDENLSLYVGWSDGYDAEETNEYEIHSEKNPTYVINTVIGVRNDADFADLDYITVPYYSHDGDVYNCQYAVSPSEDYTYLADTLMKAYKDIKNKIETGELLTESTSLDSEDRNFDIAFNKFLKGINGKKLDEPVFRAHGWYYGKFEVNGKRETFFMHVSGPEFDACINGKDVSNSRTGYFETVDELIKAYNEALNKSMLESAEISDSNSMETIRKYVSAQEQHKGTSIRFDTFRAGSYEYDLRVYVGGLTTKDEVRAALIPYKLDEEGRVIRVDKDIIKLDDFRLDMTDEEVRSLVSDKLGLKESLSEIDNDQDLDADQVQADVDYWADVDEANTEDVTGMEPVGVYSVSNSMAIYVYQIEYDIEDRVLAGDSSDETKAKWRDIIYGDGEAYFWYGDIKVPFNEVMRTDI